jgi:glycine dehydrogenase subunit 2
MHINLHKTFSTPHGGGGPGAGPVVLSEALAPFAPVPFVRRGGLVEHAEGQHLGRITAFNGQMGMYVRALTYMLSHGGDGLAQAAKDAVLNANYVKARLEGTFSVPFGGQPCMHEALFDDHFFEGTGVTTLDFAKALIDEGFHPMTMYFPLVVHGAMLVEPTESESRQVLDRLCDVMLELAADAKAGNAGRFTSAPMRAPRRRLDETRAARQPKLKWEPVRELPQAAE